MYFMRWKCNIGSGFTKGGFCGTSSISFSIKFNILLISPNKANWMFVIVGKCYFSNEAVHRGGNMLFRFLWRLPYLQSYDSIFSMVHCGYFVYKTKESNLVCRMCTTTLDTNGWIPAADFFFNMKMFVKNNQIKSIL
jgi:hypothetical protein